MAEFEKSLDEGIIERTALGRKRLHNVELIKKFTKSSRCVLSPAIVMKQETLRTVTAPISLL